MSKRIYRWVKCMRFDAINALVFKRVPIINLKSGLYKGHPLRSVYKMFIRSCSVLAFGLGLTPLIARNPHVLITTGTRPRWTRCVRVLCLSLVAFFLPLAVSTSTKVDSGHKSVSVSELIGPTVLLGGPYDRPVLRLLSHPTGRSTCVFSSTNFYVDFV